MNRVILSQEIVRTDSDHLSIKYEAVVESTVYTGCVCHTITLNTNIELIDLAIVANSMAKGLYSKYTEYNQQYFDFTSPNNIKLEFSSHVLFSNDSS